jgi:hypothetical protein
MDWLQLIASLVGSLAWPATVLILVLILHEPVKQALLTISRLKYKDLELDFGRELKQLEQKAKALDVKPQAPAVLPTPKKDSSQLLDEAARLATDFPEPAVAVGWQGVEEELLAAVMRLAISPDYPPYGSSLKNTLILREQKVIDEGTYELLQRMRNLRNMAVHGNRGGPPITADEAREFIALAKGIVEKLRAARRG